MGETREAKILRLEAAAERMRAAGAAAMERTPKDKHDALRRGYNDGIAVSGEADRERARANPPFSSAELRQAWRAGFDLGGKGIMVKLPVESVLPPRAWRGDEGDE